MIRNWGDCASLDRGENSGEKLWIIAGCFLLLCLLVVDGVFSSLMLSCRGSPAASYLFCFAKKGNPKKATASRCPSGSRLCKSKNGKRTKLAALKQRSLLFPFFDLHKRQRHSGLLRARSDTRFIPRKAHGEPSDYSVEREVFCSR